MRKMKTFRGAKVLALGVGTGKPPRLSCAVEVAYAVPLIVSACRFFRLKRLRAVKATLNRKHVGLCTRYDDGDFEIRLRPAWHTSERNWLDTLAHELAHLRYMEENEDHKKLTRRILAYWRDQGLDAPYAVRDPEEVT